MITARQGLISMTRWLAAIPVLLVLCVCSSSQPIRPAHAALPDRSPEWWAVLNAIEAEEDARLAKILVICNGCFAHPAPLERNAFAIVLRKPRFGGVLIGETVVLRAANE